MSTMSLLGLYTANNKLFDDIVLPKELDKSIFIDNLLSETAELEVLYPQPYFMQTMLGIWSKKEIEVWKKLYDTTVLKYDPINSYNRTEHVTEDENVNVENISNSSGESKNITKREIEAADTSSENGSDSEFVSAYNETNFTPTKRTDIERNRNGSNTQTENGSSSNNATAENRTDENRKRINERNYETIGNTGFHSKQKLIMQEREIAIFNVYDYIIDSFKKRFCLLIY